MNLNGLDMTLTYAFVELCSNSPRILIYIQRSSFNYPAVQDTIKKSWINLKIRRIFLSCFLLYSSNQKKWKEELKCFHYWRK